MRPLVAEDGDTVVGVAAFGWFRERLGFVEVARLAELGAKLGRWLDLVLVQLRLDDRAVPPEA